MHDIQLTMTAVSHALYAGLHKLLPKAVHEHDRERRDRGAVSLEQALWYAAAAVACGAVATIIWNQVRTQANTPVSPGG
ncbi:MAG: hypothetical protein ACJAR2_004227 [Ilumatobacter sp.]|jgi:hypothetical protein